MACSKGRRVRPRSMLNNVRTSCAPQVMGGTFGLQDGRRDAGTGTFGLRQSFRRSIQDRTTFADDGKFSGRFAAHQRSEPRRGIYRDIFMIEGFNERPMERPPHVITADQRDAAPRCAWIGIDYVVQPPDNSFSGIAKRFNSFDPS